MTRSGLILDERYRLDKRIAAGGVGQVWRATDLLLERPVAVKVLRPEYADHPDTLERFRKEARHAGALSHPHVAQVYDYGPAGPTWPPYLVMEFVDGPSLADVLAVDPVAAEFALDVVAQAAEGLYAAHRSGLVHRDVKPGNILIGPERLVKVADFGIAHAAGQAPVTAPNLVMGTTQYMAPERISGGPASPASDLYALGIVLHECLTGVPPYEGTAAEVMASHLYLPLPPLPADVPPELDLLVAQLTAKDPARRISDARDLGIRAATLRESIMAGRLVTSGATMTSGATVTSGATLAAGATAPAAAASDGATALLSPGTPAAPAAGTSPGGTGLAGGTSGLQAAPNGGGWAAPPGSPLPGGPNAGPDFGPGRPTGYSDEWAVSERLSQPASSPAGFTPPGQRPRRLRPATLIVGAAIVAVAALVALLIGGAFRTADQGNSTPATSPSAASTSPSSHPSHGIAQVSTPASPPAGGGVAPSTGPSSGAATPTRTKKPRPSGKPSGSAPPSSSPATAPASTPAGSATPSDGSSTPPPSSPPATTPGGTPSQPATPSPSSSCFLGLCL